MSEYVTTRPIGKTLRFASWVTWPDDCNASTKSLALPSITGVSLLVSSIRILSIRNPETAAKVCSTVWIRIPFCSIVVPRDISTT